jgi:hypothetical protein
MTRPPPGPIFMWLLCAEGMALGLAIDCRSAAPADLAALCTAEPHFALAGFLCHLTLMPATNIGMLSGGVLALALSRSASLSAMAANLACNALMLIGMALAACLGPGLAAGLGIGWGVASMMAVMTVGMTLGLAATMTLGRLTHRVAILHAPLPSLSALQGGEGLG